MGELTNTKFSDYNVIVQSPWAEWHYKIKTFSYAQFAERWTWQKVWMTKWTMVWRNNEMGYGLNENEMDYGLNENEMDYGLEE